MYEFHFKLKPDSLAPTKHPDIPYCLSGVYGAFSNDVEEVVYHTLIALSIYEKHVTDIWPDAFDIEKVGIPIHVNPFERTDVHWIRSCIIMEPGIYAIQFEVPGTVPVPSKTPIPHPCYYVGYHRGLSRWVGYFDTLDQLYEYWPSAISVNILGSGLTKDQLLKTPASIGRHLL